MLFDIDQELQRGIQFYQAGQLNKAEEIFAKILQVDANHPEALHLSGLLAHHAGKDQLAVTLIEKAIRHNPKNHFYYDNLGTLMLSQGRFSEAVANYLMSLRLNPENSNTYVNLGVAYGKQNKLAEAISCYEKALEMQPRNPKVLNLMGVALRGQGKAPEAISCFQKALQAKPDFVEALFNMGKALEASRNEKAATYYRRVLEVSPNSFHGHNSLAAINLPGEDYYSVLSHFHEWLKPGAYVEIGIMAGNSLAISQPPTIAIGIDPMPQECCPFAAETKIFKMTSDEFFASYDLYEETGKQVVELAFIDGSHIFEQALKDFINLERYAGRYSIILIHDCLPLNRATSSRTRSTKLWSGDVWKLIPCLKDYRPDLEIFTIATYPTGLGVITNLDPSSMVLKDNYDQLASEFVHLDFSYLDGEQDKKLNVISNHWPSIQDRLASRGQ